jgi:hypothetical protein
LDVKLSLIHHFVILGPQKWKIFVVLQLKSVIYTINYCADWSAKGKVLFPVNKCYNNLYFLTFDDSAGVIACTRFWNFWSWLNCSPYLYPIIYTPLSCEISRPILDWLLDNLEQPAWIPFRKNSIQESWCNSTLLNPSTISSFDNINIDCLSMYFDSEFNWMDIGQRDGACTNSLPRQEVVAYDKLL